MYTVHVGGSGASQLTVVEETELFVKYLVHGEERIISKEGVFNTANEAIDYYVKDLVHKRDCMERRLNMIRKRISYLQSKKTP